MALQASLIMLDNSAFGLNGDYLPTRWQSQVDSASLLIQAKLQSNIQSSVGLGLMGGKQVQVLCTMTSDASKINSYLFGVKVHGQLHLTQALQIGALALKHRLNQTQKQRLICFIGSSIKEDAETLKVFGKKLKKNDVAVDLICFGDCSAQQKNKIQTFMNAVQHENNCRNIIIEPGDFYLSDKLLGSQIFNGGGNAGIMGGPGGGNMQQQDPQLAQAIRMSLQQSAMQNQQQQPPQPPPNQNQIPQQRPQTEQQLEQLAIRLSLQQANNNEGEKKEQEEDKQKKQ